MKQRTRRAAAASQTHQPAAEGAANAQGAALPPANDLESQAAAAQVEVMSEQEPGVFDAQAFIAAVKRAVEAATPSNLEEADEFKESGAVGQATAEISGLVKGGKASSEQNIAAATEAAPDLSAAVPKLVEEMVNDEPGAPPPGVGAAGAMPGPRPPEQTDLSAGPAKVDAAMATANVTDEQVARSNEPDFSVALDARQKARDHAATAPAGYRAEEEAILVQGRESAAGEAAAGLEGMHGARTGALGGALAEKEDLKGAHEAEHARVAAEIQAIYERAQTDVTTILDNLDAQVDDEFTRGEEAARTGFENEVDQRMSAFKADRYSGLGGGARWGWDKLTGMPDEVNSFYDEGRAGYLRAMDTVIEGIATTVGTGLTAARARIVEGRAEVRAYVEALPEDLRAIGEETQGKLEDRFDELSSEVDAKQDALVDAVAHRYVESRDALDARIEELQAENKGLVAAALDAVVGVIKTILALGEMLLRVLAKAAEVVGDVIADPIGFLGNLIDGVMGGLKRFVARIGTHLQNALVEWLFGTLGRVGLRLPDQLDGAGILDLVTQVIGLTYANVRARVAGVVGEPVVEQMEQSVEVFTTLASTGLGGLWELVSGKLGDLQEMVLGKIKDWVIERVIEGGIAWIIGLLNPVAAFIKACKAIYQIVMFIVDRAKQIMEFVEAILDSISAIAKGDLGAAEEKVEGSLAKGLPLAIGFLASLLGLGDISEKVKSIIAAVRRPVEKAIDTVVMGIARTFKRTFGGAAAWAKGKVAAGRDWAKGKVDAGREWAQGKLDTAKQWGRGKAAALAPAVAAPKAEDSADPAAPAAATDQVTLRFGSESHELRGAIVDGRPSVVMASFDPDVIPKRIADLRKTYVEPFRAAGGQLDAAAAALEADLSATEKMTDRRNAAIVRAPRERQVPEMHTLLVDLRNKLERIAAKHGLPGTGWVMAKHHAKPKGQHGYRREEGALARLCIKSYSKGRSASGHPPGEKLSKFDDSKYERGHLLARALGGEGDDRNLAMISKKTNTEMRLYCEMNARENLDPRPSVAGATYSPDNVLSYDVSVTYDDTSKWLEQYLSVDLGLKADVALHALFVHAAGNGGIDRATISALLGYALTPREHEYLCELWRERFLASSLKVSMQVVQGPARVGTFGPIVAQQ